MDQNGVTEMDDGLPREGLEEGRGCVQDGPDVELSYFIYTSGLRGSSRTEDWGIKAISPDLTTIETSLLRICSSLHEDPVYLPRVNREGGELLYQRVESIPILVGIFPARDRAGRSTVACVGISLDGIDAGLALDPFRTWRAFAPALQKAAKMETVPVELVLRSDGLDSRQNRVGRIRSLLAKEGLNLSLIATLAYRCCVSDKPVVVPYKADESQWLCELMSLVLSAESERSGFGFATVTASLKTSRLSGQRLVCLQREDLSVDYPSLIDNPEVKALQSLLEKISSNRVTDPEEQLEHLDTLVRRLCTPVSHRLDQGRKPKETPLKNRKKFFVMLGMTVLLTAGVITLISSHLSFDILTDSGNTEQDIRDKTSSNIADKARQDIDSRLEGRLSRQRNIILNAFGSLNIKAASGKKWFKEANNLPFPLNELGIPARSTVEIVKDLRNLEEHSISLSDAVDRFRKLPWPDSMKIKRWENTENNLLESPDGSEIRVIHRAYMRAKNGLTSVKE